MGQLAVHTPLAQLVGVALHALANLLVADVLAPNVGIGQEEALLGREAVDDGKGSLLRGILEGLEGHHETTVVGHVLAQRERAVGMETGQHLDAVVEGTHHLDALLEALAILVAPPAAQVAFLVILGTLVVESVGHLVTDHHTDGAIVEGIVCLHVEEGRLQNAGGEADLVGRRVVIGIHRLRRHVPLVAIDGLVELGANHLLDLPFVACQDVAQVAVANLQGGVVFPLIGVAHLHVEGVELVLCHLLRLVAHPVLHGDTLAERHLQVGHQALHALLGCGREEALHIELSQGLAQCAFDRRDGTLPARTVLLLAAHGGAVEGKVHGTALVIDVGRGHVQGVPEIDVLQGFDRLLLEHCLHLVDGCGLAQAYLADPLHTDVLEVGVPVDAGELLLQLLVADLVIVGLGVAQLGHALAGTCQAGLDADDVGPDAAGILLAESLVLAEGHHVGLVGLTDALCLGVFVHIVVLLAQCESALIDGDQIVLRVLLVGTDVHAEESGHALALHARPDVAQPLLRNVARGLIAVAEQELLECSPIMLVQVHAVHGRTVERGYLLCHAAGGILLGRDSLDELAQLLVVVLLQHVEGTVAAVLGGQGIGFLPSTRGIHVEALPRLVGGVHVGQVDARCQGLVACRAGGRSCGQCHD